MWLNLACQSRFCGEAVTAKLRLLRRDVLLITEARRANKQMFDRWKFHDLQRGCASSPLYQESIALRNGDSARARSFKPLR
jgi:hypothetical protein